MTIQYKLLGKPKTLDEFIDKARKKRIEKINIRMFSYDGIRYGGGFWDYHCYACLFAGKIKLNLQKHTHVRLGDLHQTIIGKAEIDRAVYKDAINSAEKLTQLGFDVTIAGKPVSNAKKTLIELDEYIKEKREEFGLTGILIV